MRARAAALGCAREVLDPHRARRRRGGEQPGLEGRLCRQGAAAPRSLDPASSSPRPQANAGRPRALARGRQAARHVASSSSSSARRRSSSGAGERMPCWAACRAMERPAADVQHVEGEVVHPHRLGLGAERLPQGVGRSAHPSQRPVQIHIGVVLRPNPVVSHLLPARRVGVVEARTEAARFQRGLRGDSLRHRDQQVAVAVRARGAVAVEQLSDRRPFQQDRPHTGSRKGTTHLSAHRIDAHRGDGRGLHESWPDRPRAHGRRLAAYGSWTYKQTRRLMWSASPPRLLRSRVNGAQLSSSRSMAGHA